MAETRAVRYEMARAARKAGRGAVGYAQQVGPKRRKIVATLEIIERTPYVLPTE